MSIQSVLMFLCLKLVLHFQERPDQTNGNKTERHSQQKLYLQTQDDCGCFASIWVRRFLKSTEAECALWTCKTHRSALHLDSMHTKHISSNVQVVAANSNPSNEQVTVTNIEKLLAVVMLAVFKYILGCRADSSDQSRNFLLVRLSTARYCSH